MSDPQAQGFQWQLARAYIPWQKFTSKWNPLEGLNKGTIFPELCFPYQHAGR
ncbi:MAG: spore coat associated protein CotJA [Moorellaceae bacterium]